MPQTRDVAFSGSGPQLVPQSSAGFAAAAAAAVQPASAPARVDTPSTYPAYPEALPPHVLRSRNYAARFARTGDELRALQRLRFDVFNLELGEGLASSFDSGLDRDEYDAGCHHVLVTPADAPETVIGTYRMQTSEMARRHLGFYASSEFDLAGLPPAILDNAVELGRACIAAQHRHTQVLMLLWKAIAQYLAHNNKHHLFGCCSVSTQDPAVGWRLLRYLHEHGHVDARYRVVPQPDYALPASPAESGGGAAAPATSAREIEANRASAGDADRDAAEDAVAMPPLMRLYLRYGGRVVGTPAIDRRFGTIDFLVCFDVATLSEDRFRAFFGSADASFDPHGQAARPAEDARAAHADGAVTSAGDPSARTAQS